MRLRVGRRLTAVLFGLTIVLLLIALRVADPYPVQALRNIAFDSYQRLSPRPHGDFPVRVVDIDEASLSAIGQWPWPRDELARLADRLTDMGAAAVAFDVLFPEPDRLSPTRLAETLRDQAGAELIGGEAARLLPDFDADFARALERAPSILGFSISPATKSLPQAAKAGFAISGVDPTPSIPAMGGAVLPLPVLGEAARGMGALSLNNADSIDVLRRVPLVWSAGGKLFPSLAIEALRVALGTQTIVVFGDSGGQGYVESIRVGDYTIPTTASGDLTLYYSTPNPDLYISAKDILGPVTPELSSRVAGHIVLIGTSASGLLDLQGTPLGDNVAGVSIHAQMIEQILSSAYLIRADWVSGLELLVLLGAGMLTVAVVLFFGPLPGLLLVAAAGGALAGFAWVQFSSYGVLFDPSFPLVGLLITYTSMIFFKAQITDADRKRIRSAFGHYVAPTLLAQIERSGDKLRLGGELRDLSVMFADVRNFTGISEKIDPVRLVGMLNTLFNALGNQITAQSGTIDKFLGDAIMAFWNAPIDVDNHPVRACEAALGMRQVLAELNAADAFGLRAEGSAIEGLSIGIGINTGEALVGNMGHETRFDYSCVGDTVNLASRIEGVCKLVAFDIVVAEATRARAAGFAYLEAGDIQFKGKSSRETVHILVGDETLAAREDFQALKAQHERLIARLRFGGTAGELLDHCTRLSREIEPQLGRFYQVLATRTGDFGNRKTEAAEEVML